MSIRYPSPLQPGDLVGVTAPPNGVPADLLPLLAFCLEHLRWRGYDVVVGDCLDGEGVVSAPAREQAAELTRMLLDPRVRAVVPPWGKAAGDVATDTARDRWRMRFPDWFDDARAVLVGRTTAPGSDGFSQLDAVRIVLGDLGLPVVLDVDCGHVPPHLALVNGALCELEVDGEVQRLAQTLA